MWVYHLRLAYPLAMNARWMEAPLGRVLWTNPAENMINTRHQHQVQF